MSKDLKMNLELADYFAILKRRGWLVAGVILAIRAVQSDGESSHDADFWSDHTDRDHSRRKWFRRGGHCGALLDPSWARTQIELIGSDDVLSLAGERLGSKDIEGIGESLSVTLVPDTQVADVVVENASPEKAATWATAIADAFIEYRRAQAIQTTEDASQQVLRRIQQVEKQQAAADNGTAAPGMTRTTLQAQLTALQTQLMQIPDGEALRRGGGT